MIKFLQRLKNELNNKLPGESTHLELMPETRKNHFPSQDAIEAGVLILLYPNNEKNLSMVFMKRPEYSGHHSSQISFPGGKIEPGDKSLEETAIRESHEEIGINKEHVHIIGKLSTLYIPVSSFLVHPFVGYISNTPGFVIDKGEVDYIIEPELTEIMCLQKKSTCKSFRDKLYNIPYFEIRGEIVWGATAMILNEFITVMKRLHYE